MDKKNGKKNFLKDTLNLQELAPLRCSQEEVKKLVSLPSLHAECLNSENIASLTQLKRSCGFLQMELGYMIYINLA